MTIYLILAGGCCFAAGMLYQAAKHEYSRLEDFTAGYEAAERDIKQAEDLRDSLEVSQAFAARP
jgi:hypothetical protein